MEGECAVDVGVCVSIVGMSQCRAAPANSLFTDTDTGAVSTLVLYVGRAIEGHEATRASGGEKGHKTQSRQSQRASERSIVHMLTTPSPMARGNG